MESGGLARNVLTSTCVSNVSGTLKRLTMKVTTSVERRDGTDDRKYDLLCF